MWCSEKTAFSVLSWERVQFSLVNDLKYKKYIFIPQILISKAIHNDGMIVEENSIVNRKAGVISMQ